MNKLKVELKAKNDALASVHADLMKYKDKRENLINAYMTCLEFQELMTKHDEWLYLTLFPVGWNAGIWAVREKFPEVDPMDFEPPGDPIIIKQLMESTEDQEIEEWESEGETEEKEEEGSMERILDPVVTPLKSPGIQSSSSSGSSSSEDGEEGLKDIEFEPLNVP